ncbi:hypothetical protein EPO05_03045 [Patescibacteria group bacterium]|nr:MAG: hypothetical protein EPO05_03045 [Patescibacteria group bacterium]
MLSPGNWSRVGKALTFKEKVFVSLCLAALLASLAVWVRFLYIQSTVEVAKRGGEYAEGVIGQPMYINPLLSQTNESDADLVQLIYAGLFKYDAAGLPVPDLAERYEVSEDQKTYTVFLRDNLFWHDGERVTANDVKFTVDVLQNPTFKSPLRQSWQRVVETKVLDDRTVTFQLSDSYAQFPGVLTLGLLPSHLWEGVTPERFLFADGNSKPIGAGPFAFAKAQKNASGETSSIELASFPKYHNGEPYISRIVFNFYLDEDALVAAYNKREVKGIGNLPLEKLDALTSKNKVLHELLIPRYYSVFFNQKASVPLASKEVRQALSFAVNRDQIIQDVLRGKGTPTYSPFLSQMPEYNPDVEHYLFDVERAKKILDEAGWKMNDEKGVREKNGTELHFTLFTVDWPDLSRTTDILQAQWKEAGVAVDLQKLTVSDLQQNHIRPRDYDALLVGQELSFSPDAYSFWHSNQREDAGFNFALFNNKRADQLLEEIRTEPNPDARIEKSKELQKIFADEAPAAFLYSPYYLYPMDDSVHGFTTQKLNTRSARFSGVEAWYVKTKRVRK